MFSLLPTQKDATKSGTNLGQNWHKSGANPRHWRRPGPPPSKQKLRVRLRLRLRLRPRRMGPSPSPSSKTKKIQVREDWVLWTTSLFGKWRVNVFKHTTLLAKRLRVPRQKYSSQSGKSKAGRTVQRRPDYTFEEFKDENEFDKVRKFVRLIFI